MIDATPLVQDPRPTLVGERVNSQGSRKAKELLLADDYDGFARHRRGPGAGGAHVLSAALTERQDEADQMREIVKKISLSLPSPIQIDSTEPDVIEAALEQIPGRAIVNSVEAGRAKLDYVAALAKAHGAAVIALTIDEVGMAKTAARKLEVAQRITQPGCDEHGLDPDALIFDCLTFTLTTGDPEWRPSAVETIEGIRLVKEELPGVKIAARRQQRQLRWAAGTLGTQQRLLAPLRRGSTSRWSTPTTSRPTPRFPRPSASSADDLVLDRREDALERFIAHFEAKDSQESDAAGAAPPT